MRGARGAAASPGPAHVFAPLLPASFPAPSPAFVADFSCIPVCFRVLIRASGFRYPYLNAYLCLALSPVVLLRRNGEKASHRSRRDEGPGFADGKRLQKRCVEAGEGWLFR